MFCLPILLCLCSVRAVAVRTFHSEISAELSLCEKVHSISSRDKFAKRLNLNIKTSGICEKILVDLTSLRE